MWISEYYLARTVQDLSEQETIHVTDKFGRDAQLPKVLPLPSTEARQIVQQCGRWPDRGQLRIASKLVGFNSSSQEEKTSVHTLGMRHQPTVDISSPASMSSAFLSDLQLIVSLTPAHGPHVLRSMLVCILLGLLGPCQPPISDRSHR